MTDRRTVEVAFELARSGACRTIDDLKKGLRAQGCEQVDAHLSSSILKAQLLRIIEEAPRS